MNVKEYEAEFDSLSQFVPFLVANEMSGSRRFADGVKNHF